MKNKVLVIIGVVLAVIVVVIALKSNLKNENVNENEVQTADSVEISDVLTKPQEVVRQQVQYEQLQQYIEDGKSYEFVLYLINDEVSEDIFAILRSEDKAAIEYIMVEGMVSLAKNNQVAELTMLRKEGFISNTCFENYWEVMGSILPAENAAGEDPYLLHELHQAYLRDSYVIRAFNMMRTEGILDDMLHNELVSILGFDYTDRGYVEENNISPLQELTEEEKVSYEIIIEAIDQSDSLAIVEHLLLGQVSEQVYAQLMEDDAEIMNYVIAEGMAHLMETMRYQDIVRLRLDGFIPDQSFVTYWDILGSEQPAQDILNQKVDGMDQYLFCELVQIFYREENGQEILRDICYSGLLNDIMHEKITELVG